MFANQLYVFLRRSFHSTPIRFKAKAGRYSVSKFNNKPLTYDQAFKPHNIAVHKGWLSAHTGNLHGEKGASARIYEDQFIRVFLNGTFHRLLPTEPCYEHLAKKFEGVVLTYVGRDGSEMAVCVRRFYGLYELANMFCHLGPGSESTQGMLLP